ncbi:DnaA N-terminal domain-containing protein [Anaerosalibacter bizertensis]|uniref:DnaA N-terminal domain-containing protein n=1 Tax=Anaerosalibacter bizertensis TaxID=932217 RepID=UPI0035190C4F
MTERIDLLLMEIQRIKESIGIIENELKAIKAEEQSTNIDMELLDIWNKAIDIIKKELTEVSFNTWIRDINPIEINDNSFYISVKNAFAQNIVKERYGKLIKNALKIITNKDYNIEVLVEGIDNSNV